MGHLPEPVGSALRDAASAAFVTGMDTVALVCAIVMLGAVVIAWRGLAVPAVDGATAERVADEANRAGAERARIERAGAERAETEAIGTGGASARADRASNR